MHHRSVVGAAVTLVLMTAPAWAGPCTSQIAQLDRTLSQSAELGPATTGALSGAGPGAIKTNAAGASQASATGTSASGKMGGTGGTKEMSAAANQVATSAEDVRRQQAGQPTMAAASNAPASSSAETKPGNMMTQPSERVSQAKMDVERARALDAKGDQACMDPVQRAQGLLKGG